MSTRAKTRVADEEASKAADAILDIIGAVVAFSLAIYATLSFKVPDDGIELVLTAFFGSIFWLFAIVMMYKVLELLFSAVAVEPEGNG